MRVLVKDLKGHLGQEVELMGFLHWRRDLGKVQFLLLRDRSGVVQVVTGGRGYPFRSPACGCGGWWWQTPRPRGASRSRPGS